MICKLRPRGRDVVVETLRRLFLKKKCDVNKTLKLPQILTRMLEAEKSFEEVKGWSRAHKKDLVPIHDLRNRLDDELCELEKQELHRREED